jgi:hypothetical protein
MSWYRAGLAACSLIDNLLRPARSCACITTAAGGEGQYNVSKGFKVMVMLLCLREML